MFVTGVNKRFFLQIILHEQVTIFYKQLNHQRGFLIHNIVDEETPLVIELFVEDGYLLVKNNLQKKSFVDTSNKQGLDNLLSLYKYLSDRPMLIEEDVHYFTVKIPLI